MTPPTLSSNLLFKLRPVPFAWVVALSALVAGCESVTDTMQNHLIGEPPPQVRTFAADPKATFAAAKAALDSLSLRFTGGGPAQGRMTAISAVSPGEATGSSHQFTLKAEFHPTLDGTGTEVSVRMTEVIEADSSGHPGMGTETPLRDTALIEVFLRGIQQNLGPAAK